MNKTIKLAVAGAVFAAASVANAGIIIPAGDWTLDISGNVNTFATWTRATGAGVDIAGGIAKGNATGSRTESNITTGLLPNFLAVSGSTRQNDLDVAFTISINPGSSTTAALNGDGKGSARQENRQAFLTFGDKSWGSIKIGKDLGVFASDAILNDMTLLGVGSGAGQLAGGTTTLGRIGTGFIYADWKSQIAYTTPNFNGLQGTVAITQAWNQQDTLLGTGIGNTATSKGRAGAQPAYEAKASYSFANDAMNGKVWASGIYQKAKNFASVNSFSYIEDSSMYGGDIGATVNVANFGLTGYYYGGTGLGTTLVGSGGFANIGETIKARDSDGGYIQATYVLPTKTKVGVSWGVSNLDRANGESTSCSDGGHLVKSNEMWTVGAYHPLTKHLNLVAEFSEINSENHRNQENTNRTGSLGAIMFF